MKKCLKKIFVFSRLVVVLLLVLALAVDGAASAGRLFANCDEIDQPETKNAQPATLQQGPPLPEELPGNMEDGGKPYTEQAAIIQAVIIVNLDNSSKRFKIVLEKHIHAISFNSLDQNKSYIIKNSHEVCSDLGLQFTLLGAKPSGTS